MDIFKIRVFEKYFYKNFYSFQLHKKHKKMSKFFLVGKNTDKANTFLLDNVLK